MLALTKSQLSKIKKAYEQGKGVTIKLSKKQVMHNKKVEGGFIAALLPWLATAAKFVAPALATGALSTAASTAVKKILGKGLFLSKGGCLCELEVQGEGLFLKPPPPNFKIKGDGLWLKPSASARARRIPPPEYSGTGLPFLNVLL